MKPLRQVAIVGMLLGLSTPIAAAEIEIPTNRVETGKYYLVQSHRKGDIVTAIVKRVGPSGINFNKSDFNCATGMTRFYAESSESAKAIKKKPPTVWYEILYGSSKSDTLRFVCRR